MSYRIRNKATGGYVRFCDGRLVEVDTQAQGFVWASRDEAEVVAEAWARAWEDCPGCVAAEVEEAAEPVGSVAPCSVCAAVVEAGGRIGSHGRSSEPGYLVALQSKYYRRGFAGSIVWVSEPDEASTFTVHEAAMEFAETLRAMGEDGVRVKSRSWALRDAGQGTQPELAL